MKHLVDKDDIVAEIERRIKTLNERLIKRPISSPTLEKLIEENKKVLFFLNTLEVKEVDLEKDVRQIVSLYYEGIKYYEDVIKKEREENGGSDLAIKIMDGVVDARELSIQYVIDKLKAQKGE